MIPARTSAPPVASNDEAQPCACCGHHNTPSKPCTPNAPKRTPLPYGQCPCSDHSLSTDVPKIVSADLALAAPLPVIEVSISSTAADPIFDLSTCPLDHSLQLIHCVWQC
jgi:hypothetical protein